MIQEHKELLLKVLCARLPYKVICKDNNINVIGILSQIGLHYNICSLDKDDGDSEYCNILNCKPYLFPLSSMTEEQRKEWHSTMFQDEFGLLTPLPKSFDWLNAHHFDYRGLIEKGLANDATNLNIY